METRNRKGKLVKLPQENTSNMNTEEKEELVIEKEESETPEEGAIPKRFNCLSSSHLRTFVLLQFVLFVPWLLEFYFGHDPPVRVAEASNDTPIDIVYTWVNGTDPDWQDEFNSYVHVSKRIPKDGATKMRFQETEELLYSLRSVYQHMPWVHRLHMLTNGQRPNWMREDHPQINWVTHRDVWKNVTQLPVFNSVAIESHLHRIPDLTRYFVYSNDDCFFLDDILPQDVWSPEGGLRLRMAAKDWRCQENCPHYLLGDGICQPECNHLQCVYDLGDCGTATADELVHGDGAPSSYRTFLRQAEMMADRNLGYDRHKPRFQQHISACLDKEVFAKLEELDEFDFNAGSRFRSFDGYDPHTYFIMLMTRSLVEQPQSDIHRWVKAFDLNQDAVYDRQELGELFRALIPMGYYSNLDDQDIVSPILTHSFEGTECEKCESLLPLKLDFLLDTKFVKNNYAPAINQRIENGLEKDRTEKISVKYPHTAAVTTTNYRLGPLNAIEVSLFLREMTVGRAHFNCLNNFLYDDGSAAMPKMRTQLENFYYWQFPRPTPFEKDYYKVRPFYETHEWNVIVMVAQIEFALATLAVIIRYLSK